MKIKIQKFLAITTISGIMLPSFPVTILAVGNPNGPTQNNYWSEVAADSYANSLYSSATTVGPENYVEKNAEQAKSEAETLKQQQEEDKQKCESDAKGGAALSNKFKDVMQSTIQKVLTESIQKTVTGELGNSLKKGNKGDLGASLKSVLTELPDPNDPTKPSILNKNINKIVAEKMRVNLAIALDNATAGGAIADLDPALKESIIKEELTKSIHEATPEAMKLSMKEALPIAIKNSFKTVLPDLIHKGVTDGLDPKMNPTLQSTLRENISTRLGPSIFSKLSEREEEGKSGIIGGGTGLSIGTAEGPLGVIMEVLGGFSANSSDALERATYGSVQPPLLPGGEEIKKEGEVDKMTAEILKKFEEGDFQQQTIDTILAELNKSQINPSTGSSSTLLDDLLSNISIDSVGTQVGPSLDSALQQSLGGSLEGIVGEIASGGDFSSIVTDLTYGLTGNLTEDLLGGVLDDALGGALGGVAGDLLSPITDQLDGVLGDVLSPITGALDGVMNSVLSPITGALNQVMNTVLGPITGALNNVIGTVLGPIGGILTDPIGTITSAVTGGLLFVPVKETPGQLTTLTGQVQGNTDSTANNTGQIDKTTKSMEKLTVDICTKTKALERQSAANEQKNFVEDPKMHRSAAEATEQFRQAHSDFINKGYDTDGDRKPDAPLYVQNYQDYVTDYREEAKNVYFDYMENTDDVFKDETQYVLRSEFSDQSSVSTVSKEDYQRFVTGQVTDPEEWRKLRLAINDISRPNSPETSARINREKLTSYISTKEEEAKTQLAIGEGYLPIRDCIERTADNSACKRWETKTPQVQVKETTAKVYDYRIDNYINPQTGDVAPGNEPQIEELLNFKPSTSGGGGAAPSGKNIANIIKTLLGLIRNFRGEGPVADTPTGQLTFTANTTPFSSVQAGQVANISTLSWSATNVKSCKVVGGWAVKAGANALASLNKDGDPLPTTGSYNVILPLTFDTRLTRTRDNVPNFLNVSSSLTSLAYDKKTIEIATSSLQVGDKLSIGFWPFVPETSVEITIDTVDATTIASQLQSAINNIKTSGENPSQKNLFNLYTFTTTGGKIEITPNLTYKMSCVYDGVNESTGDSEEKTLLKEATIKR
jgi:hypothetical protein